MSGSQLSQVLSPRFLAPRYWPLWAGVGLLWLGTRLPYRWQHKIGAQLGRASYYLTKRRRSIAKINIDRCFPELDRAARLRLVKRTFRTTGISVMEIALAWWGSDKTLAPLCHIEGLSNLKQAVAKGKGVILFTPHMTCLEIAGRLLSLHHPLAVMYLKHGNPLLEALTKSYRERHLKKIIERNDTRGFLRALKKGWVCGYLPDQDMGRKYSVFAPFMGIQTATVVATSRFARISGAPVVPFLIRRLDGAKGYQLSLLPALDAFPSGDNVADATRINRLIEAHVRQVPDQYLWLHRRFKTRPLGEPDFYRRD